jgi:hypothetical protein
MTIDENKIKNGDNVLLNIIDEWLKKIIYLKIDYI